MCINMCRMLKFAHLHKMHCAIAHFSGRTKHYWFLSSIKFTTSQTLKVSHGNLIIAGYWEHFYRTIRERHCETTYKPQWQRPAPVECKRVEVLDCDTVGEFAIWIFINFIHQWNHCIIVLDSHTSASLMSTVTKVTCQSVAYKICDQ